MANSYDVHIIGGRARGINKQMLLELEAWQAGLRTIREAPVAFVADAGKGTPAIGFHRVRSSRCDPDAHRSCRDKQLIRLLLDAAGLPVPAGVVAPKDGLPAVDGWPVVVKPARGLKGAAVTTDVTSQSELRAAIDRAAAYSNRGVLVERQVPGLDYRMLATPTRVLSVVRRDPAHVVGDGTSTIAELVDAKNKQRRHNPNLTKKPIVVDDEMMAVLARDGLALEGVPEPHQMVRLRWTANVSRGGETIEVRDETHPTLLELATAAVRAVPGLDLAGVDVMVEDHRQPAASQQVHVLELNGTPAIMSHLYPNRGQPVNVIREIVRDVAADAGLPLRDPRSELAVEATVHGLVRGVGMKKWLRRQAIRLDVDLQVDNGPARSVVLVASGQPERVAMLMRRAMSGPEGVQPTLRVAVPT